MMCKKFNPFARISLLFIAMMAVACSGTGDNTQPTPLNVIAYNVEYGKSATAEEIGEALLAYSPDVVCFSEAPGGDWTQRAAAVLGLDHVVVGRYSTAGHADKYKTIASRTPLYDYEEVLMTDTLHTATKAKTRIKNHEIVVYAVHFPFGWRDQAHIDETTRKVSALVDYVSAAQHEGLPQLLMGDFNFVLSTPGVESPYYDMFAELGFTVTWNELGIDVTKENTYIEGDDESEPGEVIDHIMYESSRFETEDGGIVVMERELSDHKAIWATLSLK